MIEVREMEVHFVNRIFDKADPPKSSRELALFLFPELRHHDLREADLDVKALSQGTTNGVSVAISGCCE